MTTKAENVKEAAGVCGIDGKTWLIVHDCWGHIAIANGGYTSINITPADARNLASRLLRVAYRQEKRAAGAKK